MAIVIRGLGKSLPLKEMKNTDFPPEPEHGELQEKVKQAHRWPIRRVWMRLKTVRFPNL